MYVRLRCLHCSSNYSEGKHPAPSLGRDPPGDAACYRPSGSRGAPARSGDGGGLCRREGEGSRSPVATSPPRPASGTHIPSPARGKVGRLPGVAFRATGSGRWESRRPIPHSRAAPSPRDSPQRFSFQTSVSSSLKLGAASLTCLPGVRLN